MKECSCFYNTDSLTYLLTYVLAHSIYKYTNNIMPTAGPTTQHSALCTQH